jgi:hypothetical protein
MPQRLLEGFLAAHPGQLTRQDMERVRRTAADALRRAVE